MPLKINSFEPIALPKPYTRKYHLLERKRFKQLGISPSVENGIKTWRVIWRPFLSTPVPYTKRDGSPGLKRKSDEVRTLRFPIVGTTTEEAAYRQALQASTLAYRQALPRQMPIIDWEQMARAKGVKLRSSYAKPALNGALDRALAMFEAGYGLGPVAKELGVDKSTACRWRKRLIKEKALPDGRA